LASKPLKPDLQKRISPGRWFLPRAAQNGKGSWYSRLFEVGLETYRMKVRGILEPWEGDRDRKTVAKGGLGAPHENFG